MFLSRADETDGRQTLPSTTFHYSRFKTISTLYLLLFTTYVQMAPKSTVSLTRGPSTGIITQEIPNLLLTEHKIISQLIYIDLDIEAVLSKSVSLRDVHDATTLLWYQNHIERAKVSIREILEQAEKTIVLQQPPSNRPKRAIGAVVMGIMAFLTVVGTVVGSTMNAVNSVSIKAVQRKNDELQEAIKEIQSSLAIQHKTNEHLVSIIKDTIVVASLLSERMDHSMMLHEQLSLTSDLFYAFVEPILYYTNSYLRQLETNMNNLLKAYIPLYFVDVHLVRTALSTLHGLDLDPTQIRIAFEAGSAIPMYINADRMHVSFLLNIPLVKTDKIYQLKKIFNVGTWEGDTKTKINSPELIAYQNTSDMYLVPNLQSCQIFKDTNYLCPGNPFTPMKGGFLCGLEDTTVDSTLCDVTVSRPSEIVTEAVLVNNMWLVSTNAPNMTITYTKHGTFTVKPIPHSTFTTVVPKDVIISIGSETLFYVSTGDLEGGMELVNTFKSFSIPRNTDLDLLLDKKQSHSLQLLLKQDNISISDLKFSSADSSFFRTEDSLHTLAHILWSGSATIWMAALSIIVVFHHRYIRRATERDSWRQREYALAVV